jgi:hypothetical protein
VVVPDEGYTISSPRVTFEDTVFNQATGMYELNIRLVALDFHRAKAYKWLVLYVQPDVPTVLGTLPDHEVPPFEDNSLAIHNFKRNYRFLQ